MTHFPVRHFSYKKYIFVISVFIMELNKMTESVDDLLLNHGRVKCLVESCCEMADVKLFRAICLVSNFRPFKVTYNILTFTGQIRKLPVLDR